MANTRTTYNRPKRMVNANGKILSCHCRWTTFALVVLLAGCTTDHARSSANSATSRPSDITCARCTMKHYVWDSRARRYGTMTHHDIWNNECPDCVVRMSGIWLLIGPSHICQDCPAGAARCPMCRAANRGDGKYPTSQPQKVQPAMQQLCGFWPISNRSRKTKTRPVNGAPGRA